MNLNQKNINSSSGDDKEKGIEDKTASGVSAVNRVWTKEKVHWNFMLWIRKLYTWMVLWRLVSLDMNSIEVFKTHLVLPFFSKNQEKS